MLKKNGLFILVFFLLLGVLSINMKKMVTFIILSELVILNLIFMLVALKMANFYALLVCLLVGVCEAAVGLSLVVLFARKSMFFLNNVF